MTCPNEFTLSMYADGELPPGEARPVREHLLACSACRRLSSALQEENRALVHALQEIDLVEGTTETAAMTGIRVGVFVLAIAIGLRAVLDWISGFSLPATFEFVDPSQRTGQMNLVINSIVYFILDGGSMLVSAIDNISFLALNGLILFGIIKILRRSLGTSAILSAFLLIAFISTPTYALDVRKGAPQITVRADEIVDDTLVAFGETVNIDGTVNGDVIVFARRINVSGTVKGNVMGFAQRVDVSGTVEGDILGFAQTVETRGHVAKNIFGFAQNLGVADTAQIDGNVTMFGAETSMNGTVGRDLTLFSGRADVRGNVGRNVVSHSERITLIAPARVGGDFIAHVPRTELAQIAQGATVAGRTDIRLPEPRPSRYMTLSFYIWQCIWLAGAFVVGLILFSLLPSLGRSTLDTGQALLKAGGIGFLVAVATPVAAVIVGITMIGLPIALLAVVLWITGLYLAKIVLAAFLGRALMSKRDQRFGSVASVLLVGLVVISIAVNLPYIGGVISFLLTLIGFGMLLIELYRVRRTPAAPVNAL